MTPIEKLELEIIDDMLSWSSDQLYNTFGSRLEAVVEEQKEKMRAHLKRIWKFRKLYAFRDTGDSFYDDTMLLYFDPKKIGRYKLQEMETITQKIEKETILQTK